MESLILTRYLFGLDEVRYSLFIEILNRNFEEALFWCYELYWSGYENETFIFLLDTYKFMYIDNDLYINRFNEEYDRWKIDNSHHECIGNIVINICFRNFSISKFINEYFAINCKNCQNEEKRNNLYINLKKEDIIKYETEYSDEGVGRRKTLQKIYKYQLKTETNRLFEHDIINKDDQIKEIRENWEFYAIKCPYWKSIFQEYGGFIENDKIRFSDTNKEEDFYNKYDFEIDEQPKWVQNYAVGLKDHEKQLNIREFLERYGGQVLSNKLKKKKINITTAEA
jgi:hypothetical protein